MLVLCKVDAEGPGPRIDLNVTPLTPSEGGVLSYVTVTWRVLQVTEPANQLAY